MSLERVLLHTTGFELSVEHPYMFLVEQISKLLSKKLLRYSTPPNPSAPKDQLRTELAQYSMSFANDSMQTSLCLQFSPQVIATACVYLACLFAKVEPSSGGNTTSNWSSILGDHTDMEHLASIGLQILDVKGNTSEKFQQVRGKLESQVKAQDGRRSPVPSAPPPKRPKIG